MKYLHFIVNPISGKANHIIDQALLTQHFPSERYTIKLEYSEYKKHAEELARIAVLQNPDCIIACGGDGTINEVASAIVGTNIILGIIPVGSGNGLATNLKIPQDIPKAIEILKEGTINSIDVGLVNGQYFFSNMGIGIDAMIIKKYEKSKKRTLFSYVKASISSSFEFKETLSQIEFEGKTLTKTPFLLFISNSNEMGYNMSLTPTASLSDGFLDLVVVPEISFFEKLKLGIYILRNKIQQFRKVHHHLIRDCKVNLPLRIYTDLQIDGEYHNLKTNQIHVSIIPKGLKVIANRMKE